MVIIKLPVNKRAPRFSHTFLKLMGYLLCLGLAASLQGCSVSGALKGAFTNSDATNTYDLVLDGSRIQRAQRIDQQLLVTNPVAVKVLAGESILVKPSAHKMTYYGRAAWGDRLPKLLQARMIEAIVQSGRFRDVSDGQVRVNGDVTLATTVEAFQIEVDGAQAQAVVTVFAKLIHNASGKVYASHKFSHQVGAASHEVDEGVKALNSAFNDLMADLTRWIVRRSRLRFAG